jgi:hypothetical protein
MAKEETITTDSPTTHTELSYEPHSHCVPPIIDNVVIGSNQSVNGAVVSYHVAQNNVVCVQNNKSNDGVSEITNDTLQTYYRMSSRVKCNRNV